ARRFPTTSRFTVVDRTAIVFSSIAAIVGTFLFVANLWAAVTHAHSGVAWAFAVNQPNQAAQPRYYSATIFALALPVLPIVLFRARSAAADERTRVRVFVVAMLVGI